MFAASPGLHGIEHPVYDIWLTDCKGAGETVATAPEPGAAEPSSPPPPPNASPTPVKKPAAKLRRVQPQTPKPPVDDFGEAPPRARRAKAQRPGRKPREVRPSAPGMSPRLVPRRQPTDPDALFPPADIPNGRGAPQGNGPESGSDAISVRDFVKEFGAGSCLEQAGLSQAARETPRFRRAGAR